MTTLRLALVAGELSGDTLGAGLLNELQRRGVEVEAFGVGGPAMQAAGLESWWQATDISVMGLFEVIRHLPRLLRLKKQLRLKIEDQQPHAFVGIDLPDFNLRLATELRAAGGTTIQYVSPSVWAWRPKRVKKIAKAVDLVLCLLPFEPSFFQQHAVAATFVGHPLADSIKPQSNTQEARTALDLSGSGPTIALLPGSRRNEVKLLGAIFLQAAAIVAKRLPGATFITAMASDDARQEWLSVVDKNQHLPKVQIVKAPAAQVMAAADVVLVASGTAALEALLVGRSMVVSYKVAPLTAWLIKRFDLVKVKYFSLPNILADKKLVPELLQDDATPQRIAVALIDEYQRRDDQTRREEFKRLRETLAVDANQRACDALLALLAERGVFQSTTDIGDV